MSVKIRETHIRYKLSIEVHTVKKCIRWTQILSHLPIVVLDRFHQHCLLAQFHKASSVNEIGLHSGASGDLISSSESSVSGKTKYRTLVGMAP